MLQNGDLMTQNNLSSTLYILESILGSYRKSNNGEYTFFCPSCKHRKRKFQIQLDQSNPNYGNWHCWVCESSNGTKGKSLVSLAKKFGKKHHVSELLKLSGKSKSNYNRIQTTRKEIVELPKEYIPMWKSTNSFAWSRAVDYLINHRKLTHLDIVKYQIGYCESGKYANRIIIPSYDKNGILNYFTARDFTGDSRISYINPSVSRDIIPFEMFINFNLPIFLVEGVFDAMITKLNVIPLLGKKLSIALKNSIREYDVTDIYIGLDVDALKDSISISQYLLEEGKNVYLMDMNKKDPAEVGQEQFFEIASNTKKLTFNDLIRLKLGVA